MTVKFECDDCRGKIPPGFGRLRGLCDSCAEKRCKAGIEHTWEPLCLGGGSALFGCLYCDATSEDMKNLKQLGFVEVKPEEDE